MTRSQRSAVLIVCAFLCGSGAPCLHPAYADAVPPGVQIHEITITHRHLYGPGPFPDQTLGAGYVRAMQFKSFMSAVVPAFNNGAAEPNVSGERAQGSTVDGMLSDGTKLNEHIEMGNAEILNGQFNLVLGAAFGGPNEGASYFYLDDDFNWTIRDDIVMDPGFAEGVVKIDNFIFSTGPKSAPFSIQTINKNPGGIDYIGTLVSGEFTVGRVGDDDFDGRVDGIFFAMGRFPITSVFLPGAPFVQRVHFTSDIPLESADAGLLALATARNCLRVWREQTTPDAAKRGAPVLRGCIEERASMARAQLQRALSDPASCRRRCRAFARIADQLKAFEKLAAPSDVVVPSAEEAARIERIFKEFATLQGRVSKS